MSRLFGAAAAFTAVLFSTSASGAQALRVSYVAAHANHRLLQGVSGTEASGIFDVRPAVTFRASYSDLRGAQTRHGIACAGLIMPGTCSPEPIRDDSRIRALTLGVALQVLGRRSWRIAASPGLRIATVRADSRGLTSGRRLSATKLLAGPEGDLEVSVSPGAFPRLEGHLAIGVGALAGPDEQVVDGYTPFSGGFALTRAQLGLALRLGRTGR
jgi:hypothetical protein